MSSVPTEIAATIQAASIDKHPDPSRDIAPSTAADRREPVSIHEKHRRPSAHGLVEDGSDEYEIDEEDEDEDDIPYSVLKPTRQKQNFPPLPDLRFEQSYLRSISSADRWWKVALITARDQIVMPLVQGLLFNLAVCGWRHWNKNAQLHGNTVGARVRRWWYGVNKWTIPQTQRRTR